MTTGFELLSAQNHAHLRLRPVGETGSPFAQIMAGEFVSAAVAVPILFTKDPATGNFYAGVMLGLKAGEAYLKTEAQRGGFTPLSLQREGFFISDERIVIDRTNPRFSDDEGDLLFDEGRQPAVVLRRIQSVLGGLHTGMEVTNAFIHAMTELRLIEPIDISLSFDNGERLRLDGLYTVSMDALRAVNDQAACQLFRAGHLQLAYLMAASLRHIPILGSLRNARLSPASAGQ